MSRHRARGITLTEVLIVIAILAMLASIALPGLQDHLRRGRRAEAVAGLLKAAHWLERRATAIGSYPGDEGDFPEVLTQVPSRSYRIGFSPDDAEGSGYTLSAIPQGDQAGDRCGGLTLDHSGRRGLIASSSSGSSDALQADCWVR